MRDSALKLEFRPEHRLAVLQVGEELMRDSALKHPELPSRSIWHPVGEELMRDSALKHDYQAVTLNEGDQVGEELMRDSALKPWARSRAATAASRSEKSSCATAL